MRFNDPVQWCVSQVPTCAILCTVPVSVPVPAGCQPVYCDVLVPEPVPARFLLASPLTHRWSHPRNEWPGLKTQLFLLKIMFAEIEKSWISSRGCCRLSDRGDFYDILRAETVSDTRGSMSPQIFSKTKYFCSTTNVSPHSDQRYVQGVSEKTLFKDFYSLGCQWWQ